MSVGPNFDDVVTADEEDDTERDGLFSYRAEIHAPFYGMLVGLSADALLVTMFVAFVVGANRPPEGWRKTGHLRDAVKEPAYTVPGILSGLVVNHHTLDASALDVVFQALSGVL